MAEINRLNRFLVLYLREQLDYFNQLLVRDGPQQLSQFNGQLFNQFLHIFMRARELSIPEFSHLSGVAPITIYRLSGKEVVRIQQQTARKILNCIEDQVHLYSNLDLD